MKPTLSTAEAAEVWGTTEDTLHELRRQGRAPVEPLKLGRVYRWPTALVLQSVGIDHVEITTTFEITCPGRDDVPGHDTGDVICIAPNGGREGAAWPA